MLINDFRAHADFRKASSPHPSTSMVNTPGTSPGLQFFPQKTRPNSPPLMMGSPSHAGDQSNFKQFEIEEVEEVFGHHRGGLH
jgi:hypothetical protein